MSEGPSSVADDRPPTKRRDTQMPPIEAPVKKIADAPIDKAVEKLDKAAEKVRGERNKALDNAMAQIDRAHGKNAVMRLGDRVKAPIEVIPTGAMSLDIALGIGGLPRGRVVEIY